MQEPAATPVRPDRSQVRLAIVIGGFALIAIGLWTVNDENFWDTGVYFVAVPALFAILFTLLPRPDGLRDRMGRATTIALLASAILAREGVICVAMISPLVYAITLSVGRAREKKKGAESGHAVAVVVWLVLGTLSLEGIAWSAATTMSADSSMMVNLSPAEIESRLASPPDFDRALPVFLRLGFPRPVAIEGSGIEVGDSRTVHFDDGGRLELVVESRAPTNVTFVVVSDTSAVSRWAAWERSTVTWHQGGENLAKVDWSIDFERRLAPAIYFGPLEWFGMQQAADYMLVAVFG